MAGASDGDLAAIRQLLGKVEERLAEHGRRLDEISDILAAIRSMQRAPGLAHTVMIGDLNDRLRRIEKLLNLELPETSPYSPAYIPAGLRKHRGR